MWYTRIVIVSSRHLTSAPLPMTPSGKPVQIKVPLLALYILYMKSDDKSCLQVISQKNTRVLLCVCVSTRTHHWRAGTQIDVRAGRLFVVHGMTITNRCPSDNKSRWAIFGVRTQTPTTTTHSFIMRIARYGVENVTGPPNVPHSRLVWNSRV